jgi:hypothetical protein
MVTMEKQGVPVVGIVGEHFESDWKKAAKTKGVPGTRYVLTSLPSNCVVEKRCEAAAEEMIDALIDALTRPLIDEEKDPASKEQKIGRKQDRIACTATLQEVNQYFYEREMTDGLPIIPPTEVAVKEMLTGTDLPPDHVVSVILPEMRKATVEKIAVSAVMAGCLPTYMPVLIAAVEAAMDPDFHLVEVGVSTGSYAPLMIVNGPIRNDLSINYRHGALSPGRRANATIGRALRLIILNTGRALPGIQDMGVLGSPGKYTQCMGEHEEATPWEPLHVERGCAPNSNAVSMVPITARVAILGGDTPQENLQVASQAAVVRANSDYLGSNIVFFVSPVTCDVFRDAKWSKKDIQQHLYEHARVLPTSFWGARFYKPTGRRNVEFFLGKDMAEWIFKQEGTDMPLPIVTGPDKFIVVCAGGHGVNQNAIFTCGHGMLVTREIRLPKNWKALVEKYKAREIERFRDAVHPNIPFTVL